MDILLYVSRPYTFNTEILKTGQIYIFRMGCLIHLFSKTGQEHLTNELPESFFDFKVKNIDGDIIDFSTYKGSKVIIVVNVACK